jgi:hypothetical protein
MEAIVKSLKFSYFMGAINLEVNYNKDITDIWGDNGTFKSTQLNGFTWLLFGKDAAGNHDFSIKTLDENNIPMSRVVHSVEGVLLLDGRETILKRALQEKWVKPKGKEEEVFKGNETLCWYDGVPVNIGEYNAYVSAIISEEVFKLITNPLYFFDNKQVPWAKRRAMLAKMSGGERTDADIAENNEEFIKMLDILNGKSMDLYKKSVKASIAKLKDELKDKGSAIKERLSKIPEVLDWNKLEGYLLVLTQEKGTVSGKILDASKAEEGIANKKLALVRKKGPIELDIESRKADIGKGLNIAYKAHKKKIELAEGQIKMSGNKIPGLTMDIGLCERKVETLTANKKTLLEDWAEINKKSLKFNDSEFTCPACKQSLPEGDIEEKKESMKVDFSQFVIDGKALINTEGKAIVKKIDDAKSAITELEDKREAAKAAVHVSEGELKELVANPIKEENLEEALSGDVTLIGLNKLLSVLKNEIEHFDENNKPETDTELTSKESELQTKIGAINKDLRVRDDIQKDNDRVLELTNEKKGIESNLASKEKELMVVERFETEKYTELENRVNERFSGIKFKMFKELGNGGFEQCCIGLLDGVPYQDANDAKRVNAGMEVINEICKFDDASAPIFIDNRESTNEIIETRSQIINLRVAKLYKCPECGEILINNPKCPACIVDTDEKGNSIHAEGKPYYKLLIK